jgi:hypothetical protein
MFYFSFSDIYLNYIIYRKCTNYISMCQCIITAWTQACNHTRRDSEYCWHIRSSCASSYLLPLLSFHKIYLSWLVFPTFTLSINGIKSSSYFVSEWFSLNIMLWSLFHIVKWSNSSFIFTVVQVFIELTKPWNRFCC